MNWDQCERSSRIPPGLALRQYCSTDKGYANIDEDGNQVIVPDSSKSGFQETHNVISLLKC